MALFAQQSFVADAPAPCWAHLPMRRRPVSRTVRHQRTQQGRHMQPHCKRQWRCRANDTSDAAPASDTPAEPPVSDRAAHKAGPSFSTGGPRFERSPSDVWDTVHTTASNAYEGTQRGNAEAIDDRMREQSTSGRRGALERMQDMQSGAFGSAWQNFWGRVAYQYFNWRRDSTNDLLLFVVLNFTLLILGSAIKGLIVDSLDGAQLQSWWHNVYDILSVVLGQQLPDGGASIIDQAFALAVASAGLAAFALVLALVEQVVLEVYESRVRTGGPVYEEGHTLVLGWCENQRDEETMWKLLSQLCMAHRNDVQRKTVVLMSQRPKLDMEDTFRRIIPDANRYGTKFVFRQGSPLVPEHLRHVAATTASSLIVVGDSSRSAEEADAQSLRCAILLDELDVQGKGSPDPRMGRILVELKTSNAVRLLNYCCSTRVQALPTSLANARRICRMIESPVVGTISSMLFSFNSRSQSYLEPFPQFVGKQFQDLPFYFPDGIVFGLVNHNSRKVKMNPPPQTIVEAEDELLIVRPTNLPGGIYKAATRPAVRDAAGWSTDQYVRQSFDENPMGNNDTWAKAGMTGAPMGNSPPGKGGSGFFMLPLTSIQTAEVPRVLVCGWSDHAWMGLMLREMDRGPAALPRNSEVVFFNSRGQSRGVMQAARQAQVQHLRVVHVKGDPLDQLDMADKLDIASFKCAIVLCDQAWLDPDLDHTNGISMRGEGDMLRMDAVITSVQLNIRCLLEAANHPPINLISEKVAFQGVTRFDDRYRLPLGISVNMAAFSATLMAEVSFQPKILLPYLHLGLENEMAIQDVSLFAAVEEELTFWQLQARVHAAGQVLYGFYTVPKDRDTPIDVVINPAGDEIRSIRRVWNAGDHCRKVITMAPKLSRAPRSTQAADSLDNDKLIRQSIDDVVTDFDASAGASAATTGRRELRPQSPGSRDRGKEPPSEGPEGAENGAPPGRAESEKREEALV